MSDSLVASVKIMADHQYEYSLIRSYTLGETLGTYGGFMSLFFLFLDFIGFYFFRQSYHNKMFRELFYRRSKKKEKNVLK